MTGRTNKMQLVLMLSFDALEALSGGIKLSEITAAIHLFRKMFSFIHSLKVSLIRYMLHNFFYLTLNRYVKRHSTAFDNES